MDAPGCDIGHVLFQSCHVVDHRDCRLSPLFEGNCEHRQRAEDKVNRRPSNILGWTTTIAMTIAALALLLNLGPAK